MRSAHVDISEDTRGRKRGEREGTDRFRKELVRKPGGHALEYVRHAECTIEREGGREREAEGGARGRRGRRGGGEGNRG
jgi:hypothetical protein